MPSTAETNAVPDTQLGLTEEEITLLRYHQAQAQANPKPLSSQSSPSM